MERILYVIKGSVLVEAPSMGYENVSDGGVLVLDGYYSAIKYSVAGSGMRVADLAVSETARGIVVCVDSKVLSLAPPTGAEPIQSDRRLPAPNRVRFGASV